METFLRELERHPELVDLPSALHAAMAMCVAFALSLVVIATYRRTHRGPGYDEDFAQTLILMSVVTAVVMILIGTNLARAFSLVGALSIIRFRTAIKHPRDVSFMFFAIAVGMAAGMGFFPIALTLTGVGCAMVLLMRAMRFGARAAGAGLLRLVAAASPDPAEALAAQLNERAFGSTLISVEPLGEARLELLFSVPGGTDALARIAAELRGRSGVESVVVLGERAGSER